MTTTTIEVSECCKADFVEDFKNNPRDYHDPIEIYTCKKCKLECEVEVVCEFCLGEGEVSTDERDSDGNWQRGVGSQTCICKKDI